MLRRSVKCLAWANSASPIPPVSNEPTLHFKPGSPERDALLRACKAARKKQHSIPVVINGERLYPGEPIVVPMPSSNKTPYLSYHEADEKLMQAAVDASLEAQKAWRATPFRDRAAVLLRAASMLSGPRRFELQASMVLGQSKNFWQSEIDLTEMADFFRFHTAFAEKLFAQQPLSPSMSVWNAVEYRPLEGFVTAISPFNFAAIAGNLAATPALMGNTVVWKPSPGALHANYVTYCILEACGLPPGVINFVPCSVPAIQMALRQPKMSGVAFTGSTAVFRDIWRQVGSNIAGYRDFPRVSGETGGKNFHLVHPSADLDAVAACTTRAAFEYQGQKCSACSRMFVPQSCWPALKEKLVKEQKGLRMGQPDDPSSFVCALINRDAFNRVVGFIQKAKEEGCELIAGGKSCDLDKPDSGYFVEPTILQAKKLDATTLHQEIFGPVLTVYVYDDSTPSAWTDVCEVIDKCQFGLTGSIFSTDRAAIRVAQEKLLHACGMLYINDKCTGAVVGQQPFGGARASGTNDKPGGASFVSLWVQPRTVKENLVPPHEIHYPHEG